MTETILGKISEVHFGVYEDKWGLRLTLSGSWSVMATIQCWDASVEPSEYGTWTLEDQDKEFARVTREVSSLLNDAKVSEVSNLLNKPVEFTSKNGMLDSWRILTEVL